MTPVKVRNITIGEGMPKICVPIVGVSKNEILEKAATFGEIPVDVVEWRIDWFEDVFDTEKLLDCLAALRSVLKDIPLLVTFRTSKEGGEKAIEPETYRDINLALARSGNADLIDVEIFTGDAIVSEIIEGAHEAGVKVIASNHDFHKTPDKEDIIRRLCKMQAMGADIPKIAVMPTCKKDVLTLLSATEEMASCHNETPIITMSMSGKGVISRLCGEVFGSALTFGAAGKASAPGQMAVEDLKTILDLLHVSL